MLGLAIAFSTQDSSVGVGTYRYADFLHELGHSLGLDHSFQGGKFGATPHDSLEYSVMSYSSYEGAKTGMLPRVISRRL